VSTRYRVGKDGHTIWDGDRQIAVVTGELTDSAKIVRALNERDAPLKEFVDEGDSGNSFHEYRRGGHDVGYLNCWCGKESGNPVHSMFKESVIRPLVQRELMDGVQMLSALSNRCAHVWVDGVGNETDTCQRCGVPE
jgi:hypothetical protein